MSLKEPTLKMSKSHTDPRSRILINDRREHIATKIRLAVTDSIAGVTFQPEERPGVSNLLAIESYLDKERRSCQELAELHHDFSMRGFKDEIVKVIDESMAGIRERYDELLKDNQAQYLDDISRRGAVHARDLARHTISRVRQAVGLS